MRISEIFYSVQGEGLLAGLPSVFIRSSGCNLRCVWCDTPYTSWNPEGEAVTVEHILQTVSRFECKHAVITGGEPLIAPDIGALCDRLRAGGYHVTVETAGTIYAPLTCDLISISPKLSHSTPWSRADEARARRHESDRINVEVLRKLTALADYQLKFVVDRPGDIEEIRELLEHMGKVAGDRVLLMPQGVNAEELSAKAAWVADLCKRFAFRFCPRLHIHLYGNTRGT